MKYLMIAFALIVASCSVSSDASATGGSVPNPDTKIVYESEDSVVVRFIDDETGVVCYVLDGFYSGGIHCLPIGNTNPR